MEKHLLCVFLFSLISISIAARIQDKLEDWGYVEVRPKAHMFWWLYKSPQRVENSTKPWPLVLWLQGGPGGSGVGIGNFEEIGPLDSDLKPRNSTWLQVADLLFVDSPVGTGYSYVEDINLLVKSDEEAATDLVVLLQNIFNKNNNNIQKSPVYIVAESYGGKFAVTLALSALKSIETGNLKLNLGGVALGDSWISPEDFVLSWGPLLKAVSRLDSKGLKIANGLAYKIKQQIKAGLYLNATNSWNDIEDVISRLSNHVDFYNFLKELGSDSSSVASESKIGSSSGIKTTAKTELQTYKTYLKIKSLRSITINTLSAADDNKDNLMDVIIRKKLKIIPDSILFGQQSDKVFEVMGTDFMKPRINEVDQLLAKGINVTVYNGQLDVICSTRGAEAWVEKLKWKEIENFVNKDRTPLTCGEDKSTTAAAFIKLHKNLQFYWILGAGHFVPVDQPCIALKMVHAITQSPARLEW